MWVMQRMTLSRKMVLRALLDQPDRRWYGYELVKELDMSNATVYVVLRAFREDGLVDSYWEDDNAGERERPRRRYYRLATDKIAEARALAGLKDAA
jgi:PadR family transcriptional regulator PadR